MHPDGNFAAAPDQALLDKHKWWSLFAVGLAPETAVVAGATVPTGATSLPFVSTINLRRALHQKTVTVTIKARVNSMGLLSIDQHVDWVPLLRLAQNCQEQNAEVQLVQNARAIRIQTTRVIAIGEEIKVWLSSELLAFLEIPFLRPENIVSHQAYKCMACGQTYSQPNPLKVHLAFECRETVRNVPSSTAKRIEVSTAVLTASQNYHQAMLASSTISSMSMAIAPKPVYAATKEPKTHECMFCGKLYTRKYGLKIHLRTHTGHKPLQCRFCSRPFSDPSNLNKHIRLHAHNGTSVTSSSPYQCRVCRKVLVRRRDLERHVKARHNDAGSVT